jgi:hypothetical protein
MGEIIATVIGTILFLFIVYLMLLRDGVIEADRRVRCAACGATRQAGGTGLSLIAGMGPFSHTFDWCPGCGAVKVHEIER